MTKKNQVEPPRENTDIAIEDAEYKRLLVGVAGQIASGLLVSPSPKVNSSEKIAEVAVNIAQAILKQVGLKPVGP